MIVIALLLLAIFGIMVVAIAISISAWVFLIGLTISAIWWLS